MPQLIFNAVLPRKKGKPRGRQFNENRQLAIGHLKHNPNLIRNAALYCETE